MKHTPTFEQPAQTVIKLDLSSLPNVYFNQVAQIVEFSVPSDPVEIFTPEFRARIFEAFGEKHGAAILKDVENDVGRAVLAKHLARLIIFA